MHGRLKVRTSEEEAARKKKEQELKVKAYRQGMFKIKEKRLLDEYDDELMQILTAILSKNPDIFTLWNIRRECIQLMGDKGPELFEKELSLTESCLLVNPKSYCAWHHRCWVLEHSPEPNWQREVDVCTKYLKMDERNFHVWDYRRYIVDKAKVPPSKELEFCTEKIHKNFSNYSSWHYRSKLLPVLYPHETDNARPINEAILKDELEMVLTAAFTDPNDSSAWFYQRWLLGYSQPELDIAAFKITKTNAIISFSLPVDLRNDNCSLSLDVTTKFELKNWKPINSTNQYDTIWILHDTFELNNNSESEFELDFIDESGKSHLLKVRKTTGGLFGIKLPRFEYEFEPSVLEELQGQLKSCQELLEYEPDSKWTLLTAALLMRAIDRKQYHSVTLDHLQKLIAADPLRTGYYLDMSNKWNIEFKLTEWIQAEHIEDFIDLSDIDLVSLFYEQYLCAADQIILKRQLPKREQNLVKMKAFDSCNCNVKFLMMEK
ncbi:hypothetical protein HA402_013693 [Bradysia odoriphaga]|nr:hypothetical protein HA402_013693 [Bradysia odoriphaga]